MRSMLQKTGQFFKNVGGKIKKGGKSVGNTIKSNSGTIKDAGKAVGGAILGKGTVENLGELTGENKKKGVKGLAKAGLVIGVMVAVGVLAGPLVGPLAAAVFAIGAGVATPKIASSLGSKGMENTAKERQDQRIKDGSNVTKLKERKAVLEKSASQKKKIGIAAISIGVIATILTGGTALPLLLGTFAIGGIALKSSGTDSKQATALENINENSSKEDLQKAAIAAGILKEKDVEKINEMNVQSQEQNSQVKNQGGEIELADLSSKGQKPEKYDGDIFYDALDRSNDELYKFDQENIRNESKKNQGGEIELAVLSSKEKGEEKSLDSSDGVEKNDRIRSNQIDDIAEGIYKADLSETDLNKSDKLQGQNKGRERSNSI